MSEELPEHLQGKRGDGFMGDGAARPGRHDLRLVRRAIRNGWPVSAELKKKIIDQLEQAATENGDPEIRIKASKAIIDANAQNLKATDLQLKLIDILLEKGKPAAGSTTVNVNITNDPDARRTEVLGILASLRERAGVGAIEGTVEGHVDGGPVGDADEADAKAG